MASVGSTLNPTMMQSGRATFGKSDVVNVDFEP
jgi:hypothetical protein